MKHALIPLAFAVLMAFSLFAQASSLRFNGVLVNSGKPAHLLLEHMGEPLNKTVVQECTQMQYGKCVRWEPVEQWFYRYRDLNYQITVRGGIIEKIDWSRF